MVGVGSQAGWSFIEIRVNVDMSDNPNPEIHSILARAPPDHSLHMVRSTIIVRASDALPLAASVDDEQVSLPLLHPSHLCPTTLQTEQALQEHKQQAKLIFRRITPNAEPRCSIESSQYTLQFAVSPLLSLRRPLTRPPDAVTS